MEHELFADSYLNELGVPAISPASFTFDPGYSPTELKSHLDQSSHLLCGVKLSMATWQLASKSCVFTKIKSIKDADLSAIAGGGPFEIASYLGVVPRYLDLCAAAGFDRVEFGEGFAAEATDPVNLLTLARERGLKVQFEIGRKLEGPFNNLPFIQDQTKRWISAGAEQVVIEAREDAMNVGLFDSEGNLNRKMADGLLESADGKLHLLQFEAPTKRSQFDLIEHFGRNVVLSNIRLEEVLRLEGFRRGLHPRAFQADNLRPRGPQ